MYGFAGVCKVNMYSYARLNTPMHGYGRQLHSTMQGYLRLCTDVHGYVELCTAMCGYIRLCSSMHGYIGVYTAKRAM